MARIVIIAAFHPTPVYIAGACINYGKSISLYRPIHQT